MADVRPITPQQQIADGPAHEVGLQSGGGLPQTIDARKRAEALHEPFRLDLRR